MSDEQVPPEPEPDAPVSDDEQSPLPTAPAALASAAVVLTLAALIAGGSACGGVLSIAKLLPLVAAVLAGAAVFLKLQGQSDARVAVGFTATALTVGMVGYVLLASSIDRHYCP